jgi:glycerol-3-phosphate dehydrogenase
MNRDRPHAIIIGAGFTGCATAHDLALRGFDVTVVERGEIASGTSGRTHGLLHSGARYCVSDRESAVECIDENLTLRKIAAQCIEPNEGLFIGLDDSDLAYRETFIQGAEACHIDIQEITPGKALELEPGINPKVVAAFIIPDGTFDPLRLAMAFAATAQSNRARFYTYTQVEGLLTDGVGSVTGVKLWDRKDDSHRELRGDIVVSATGSWAGQVAEMAGADVPIQPTPGVMVAFEGRLTDRAINRLNVPGDGDIALPQRRMIVVGTTSFEIDDLDYIPLVEEQVQDMIERGSQMIPGLRDCRIRGKYMSSRPLIKSGASARSIARTFKCYDHQEQNGIRGFVTITGGKATTCRGMAERTADVVCAQLGIQTACQTREIPLVSYRCFIYQ